MRAWQRWQEAQSTLQKKREAEAKLLWANKPDKLQQAKEEITEVTDTRPYHTTAAALTQAPKVFTELCYNPALSQQADDLTSLAFKLQRTRQQKVSM